MLKRPWLLFESQEGRPLILQQVMKKRRLQFRVLFFNIMLLLYYNNTFVILSFLIDDKQSASDVTELYTDAVGLDGKVHRFHLDSCETNNALEALPFFLPPPSATRRSDPEEVVLVPGRGDASTPLSSRNDSIVEDHRAAGETAVLLPAPPPADSSRRSDTEEGDLVGDVLGD